MPAAAIAQRRRTRLIHGKYARSETPPASRCPGGHLAPSLYSSARAPHRRSSREGRARIPGRFATARPERPEGSGCSRQGAASRKTGRRDLEPARCAPSRRRLRSPRPPGSSSRSTRALHREQRQTTSGPLSPGGERLSSSSVTSLIAARSSSSSPAATSRFRRPGSTRSSSERRLRPRPSQELWRGRSGARDRVRDRRRRGIRAPRAERGRQDDDGRDPRGLPQARLGRSGCPRPGSPTGREGLAAAGRSRSPVVVALPEPDRTREPRAVRRLLRTAARGGRDRRDRRPRREGKRASADAVGRTEAAARSRARTRRGSRAAVSRRADHRLRSRRAACRLGDDPQSPLAGDNDPAHDALPRRGRAARRPRGGPSKRRDHPRRLSGRADRRRLGDGDPLSTRRPGGRRAHDRPDPPAERADRRGARTRRGSGRPRGSQADPRGRLPGAHARTGE